MAKKLSAMMIFLVAVLSMTGSAWAVEIAGIVVDEAGKPVADAKIVVQELDLRGCTHSYQTRVQTQGEVLSGTDGKFALTLQDPKIEVQELQLFAIHPNYGIDLLSAHELFSERKTLSECRFVMPQRGFIQGRVVDLAGKPVEGAEITVVLVSKKGHVRYVSSRGIEKSLFSTKTGPNGAFNLEGLPQNTTVALYAEHPDYVIGYTGFSSGREWDPKDAVPVGSTDTLIKLQPAATVEGKIFWENTETPVTHLLVIAIPFDGSASFSHGKTDSVETDDKGAFVIKSLSPGTYVIRAMSAYPEVAITPRKVEITAATRITEQNLTATKGVLIAGKFVNADTKEPMAGGRINILWICNNLYDIWFDAKPDGTFEGRVTPGEIFLNASIPNAIVSTPSKAFDLSTGQDQTDLVFEVKSPLMFKGRVLDPDGKPVAGAKVFAIEGILGKPSITNQKGFFEYPLRTYNIRPGSPQKFAAEALHPSRPDLRGMIIKDISSDSDLTGDIKLIPTGTIQGKIIQEKTGKPVTDVSVTAAVLGQNQIISTETFKLVETDGNGAFTLNNLMPGSYTLRATSSKEGIILPRKVEVTQAATLTGQDLTAIKGVRIAGKFLKEGSREPVGPGQIYVQSKKDYVGTTIPVKSDGTFEGHIAPGEVVLKVRQFKNGYLPWEQSQKNSPLLTDRIRQTSFLRLNHFMCSGDASWDSTRNPSKA